MIGAGTKATRTVGNWACYTAVASTSEPIHLFSAAGEFTAPILAVNILSSFGK
jgi:hypothetical protein